MTEKAKILTVVMLALILVGLMVAYFFLAKGDPTLTGGFIATATYLVKKLADEFEEVIDMFWGIKNTQPTGGTNAS